MYSIHVIKVANIVHTCFSLASEGTVLFVSVRLVYIVMMTR